MGVEFESYVRSRYRALVSLAFSITLNRHDAEDIAQTAIARCYARRRSIDALDAYARKIVLREALKARAQSRTVYAEPLSLAEDHADAIATQSLAVDLLRQLGPRQRAVVILRYVHDESDEAIADALGISVGTVRSQASRALATMRAALSREGQETS